ncbi:hypothetical protein HAZT_HAZT009516 [Hyalella azteca]|uniref:CCAAT-binding factor domain-containing protein n=1 Tax=Hyalella azteca TaxID=294128 RepID=A0A6A0H3M0_HYAAZ|nr:hypothetical protein HAZT_HAZT009516 [Hyalella azteca]
MRINVSKVIEHLLIILFYTDDLKDAVDKYRDWIQLRYTDIISKFIENLHHKKFAIAERALMSLLTLIKEQAYADEEFPWATYQEVLNALLSPTVNCRNLIKVLQDVLQHEDLAFYTFKVVSSMVTDETEDCSMVYKANLVTLLLQLDLPGRSRTLEPPPLFCSRRPDAMSDEDSGEDDDEDDSEGGPVFIYNHDRGRQYLTKIWETVMSYTLNEELYKRCLVFIPEKVMKYLLDPIKLTDFFMTSYNLGGGVSLMAMHGVFLLMNKHNLHYPDFYNKVCSLLEPSVFNARYKPRFFMLLNVFLSSSHLPEYMVAAFVKRLSRLLLFAPANCSVLVVRCIINVLARFPSLKIMYDDEQETPVACDPYDVFQADLMQTKANMSSLWEVATVSHKAPEKLYKAASFVKRPGDLEEAPLNSYLEVEYDEVRR